MLSAIDNGIINNEFIPFFQGIYDSEEGKISGYEALIRWKLGDEYLSPAFFIEQLESSGHLSTIVKIIISKINENIEKFKEDAWFSVNITPNQIESDELINLLTELNFPLSGRLHFELTERTPITNWEAAKRNIKVLNDHGYYLKIDDFCCGYNSFLNLINLGLRHVKIDKKFIDTIDHNEESILFAILSACQTAKLEVIAEGVESWEQYIKLKALGVRFFQGYLFSKPHIVPSM
ncbi:EAL domain-containing protein [Vibrio parahaemolyticus]|nr:EAL domain-containing protein [Vibrio parahaemolyticus]EGQ7885938.1 EAL domain-containing protein [Vibrio parahaemolyticus]EGQ9371216.1 EAL domain-containing protein [Vibrio parahaemolyticus]EGQ9420346.1 EAL domain-containing protein [Vibrio parahaemolyticus]EGQ9426240.1 EAL domain-containing protein [Vibrio parahaemolyticus]